MLQKKRGFSNCITLAYVSSKKIIYIYFYCQGYENSKGLAIIQYFIGHWAITNKQMANVWTIDSVRMRDILKWFFKLSVFAHFLLFREL